MAVKVLWTAFWCLLIMRSAFGLNLNKEIIENGQQQYEMLKLRTQLPDYGVCWTSALETLNRDCKQLDDVIQTRLALQFASCFLETSGQQPIECIADDDVSGCLRHLGDRQFDSYREFFIHTQNMCSFLQVQVWHRETGRTISRLGSEAAAAAERLERSGSVQADILAAQRHSLDNQQRLMEHGQRLSRDVDAWRDGLRAMVDDFREQTAEHRDLILTVFERLTSLQQLVLDRFSWFNSLAHYVAGVVLVYLLTSTARTASARLWLFLVLTANLVLERLLAAYFIAAQSPLDLRTAQKTGMMLDSAVWLLRRAAVSCCLLIMAVAVYRYQDLNAANNRLLLELHRQHRELRRCLVSKGLVVGDSTETDGGRTLRAAGRISAVTMLVPEAGLQWQARRQTTISSRGDVVDLAASRRTVLSRGDAMDLTARAVAELTPDGETALEPTTTHGPHPAATPHRRPSSSLGSSGIEAVPSPIEPASARRSRSNTPQWSPGPYNLRPRSGAGPAPAALQSPASLRRAVSRMEALAEHQSELVRRALRPSPR